MKTIYSSLEKRFDELTPDWIVSTGRLLKAYGEKSKFSFTVPFQNGKTVRKASVSDFNGIRTWRTFETKCAFPDFVVMNQSSYERFKSAEDRCKQGLEYANPFKELGCLTGMYIEVLGSYHHSGEFVQNVSKEEHEKETIDAYQSADSKVLLLWQDEVEERWDEVCIPKLKEFLSDADYPSWSLPVAPVNNSENVWKSLSDVSYWKSLDKQKQNDVVTEICSFYDYVEYPFPDINMAVSDFRRFEKWAKNSSFRKPSRFGMNCCRHFAKSMTKAVVKGKPSLQDIWNDKELRRKSIQWQLQNATGSHNAKRFLNAMCHKIGFKVVANMRPSIAVKWAKKYGKDSGIWFDPCAGWGSRMLAAHVLGMKYIAIDANSSLVEELKEMAKALSIDAEIIHGDSSDKNTVEKAMQNRKADMVFTSPPFFDTEWYSNDKEQSILRFESSLEWHEGFLGPSIRNSMSIMKDDGILIFNIGMKERLDLVGIDFSDVSADDFDLLVEIGGKSHKERIFRVVKKQSIKDDEVQCKICGRFFAELGSHIERVHSISLEEYRNQNPDAVILRKERKRPSNLIYNRKKAYRLPDGSYVRRKDAWERAWSPKLPLPDSIVDASTVNLDKWAGQTEGIDYVECLVCGHKGKNLTRHIKSHGIALEDYKGAIKSEKCKESLSNAANASWETRGRKPKRDKSQNKTHKVNSLDETTLRHLYEDENLSDAKIGEMFDMTGEGVSYRRKKHGIATRKRVKSRRRRHDDGSADRRGA